MDSATEFLLGYNINSLHAPLAYAYNSPHGNTKIQPHPSTGFAEAFVQAQSQIALRIRLTDLWPLFEFWKDKMQDKMKIIHGLIDPILKEALAKKGREENRLDVDANRPKTLLDHLVSQTDGE